MNERGSESRETPLHFASLLGTAERLRSGELSPVSLTETMLDRLSAVDASLHSYATVMADEARAAARRAEEEIAAGDWHGPLHGMPVAVKDLYYTRGTRTMGGHAFLRSFVPDHDATVVAKLAQAGAVLLGKLTTTEGAMGGYHRSFPVPRNPWDGRLWAGVSSSGAGVATAAGLCFAALGTDTGGSIRFPAMANGVVGLKPTYGLVSRHGVLPLAESLDHVGPLARRVGDAAAVLQAIAGPDAEDPTSLPGPAFDLLEHIDSGVAGTRIGYDRAWASTDVDPGLVSAIEQALGVLEQEGAEVVEVEMPAFPPDLVDAWFTICSREAHAAHGEHYPSQAEEYGEYFREFLAVGASVTDAAYTTASELRAAFNQRFRSALGGVDAVAGPSGGVPFPADEAVQYGGMDGFGPLMEHIQLQFTAPSDFAGTPTVSLPCGTNPDGVPLTLQLLGDRLTEPTLCRIGNTYERATEWHKLVPSLIAGRS